MIRIKRLEFLGALVVIAALSASRPAAASLITASTSGYTGSGTAGNASASITNIPGVINLDVNTKNVTSAGYIDLSFPTTSTGTTNDYFVSDGVSNNIPGKAITTYTVELGTGTGSSFVPYSSGTHPTFSSTFATTGPPGYTATMTPYTLTYSGGQIAPGLSGNFSFGLSIPNLTNGTRFTLRELVAAVTYVPEPNSMALLGIGMSGFFALRRMFKRNPVA
jgi:hypothetical protein